MSTVAIILVIVALVLLGIACAWRFGPKIYKGAAEFLMLPPEDDPHTHVVDLDSEGTGVSGPASDGSDHRHVVRDSQDVGVVGDHTHDLKAYIVDVAGLRGD